MSCSIILEAMNMTSKEQAMRIGLEAVPHLEKAYRILDLYDCNIGEFTPNECKSCQFFPKNIPNLDVCICLAVRKTIQHIKQLEFDVKQKRLVDEE